MAELEDLKQYGDFYSGHEKRIKEGKYLTDEKNKKSFIHVLRLIKRDILPDTPDSIDKCIESNIEIIWYRPYDCISFPRTIPYTNLISEYCNAPFIYN